MKNLAFILIFLSMTLLLNAQPLKMSSNTEKEEKASARLYRVAII